MYLNKNKIQYRKIVNIIYGLIGKLYFYGTFTRQWAEGAFGNQAHGFFYVMIGQKIGFLNLATALFFIIGQILDFYNNTSGVWFSRISLVIVLINTFMIYLIDERWHIWSYTIDFIVFSIISIIFYLPVIYDWKFLRREL